jgi:hypothetical protein
MTDQTGYEPPRVEDLGSLTALTLRRKTNNRTDGGTSDLNTRSA